MISVQSDDFSVEAVCDELRQKAGDTGAIVTFTGLVREFAKDRSIHLMTLEHYPGMTEKSLQSIVDKADKRWDINDSIIIHRVGALKPGDQIVIVAIASRHRKDAFEAAEFIMDYLKTDAPFWKKEHTDAGEHWVAQDSKDIDASRRWGSTNR